jgi:ABC-type polysaccharide/polyol phosphate transport system ATPase subunit
MSSEIAVRAQDLAKEYRLYGRPQDRLRQMLWGRRRRFYQPVGAVAGVSFEIRRGETVGIVGQNGSGKSTLLQLVAGTLRPTRGSCEAHGRVAALLELGAGFDPELTGRENVYLNAALLGFRRAEVDARFDDIAAFADIGRFLDHPVKTYSTGMFVRLAFAVAVSIEPDVLLIDEALAVGDLRFQIKCLQRLRELKQRGVTIVLVSHSVDQVKRFCARCLWLDAGRVVMDGPAGLVADRYAEYMTTLAANGKGNGATLPPLDGLGTLAAVRHVELSHATRDAFEPLTVTVEYEILEERLPTFLLGVAIFTLERGYVFGPNTALDDVVVPNTRGRHRVQYVIPRLPLLGGTYMIDVGLFLDRGLACLDYRLDAGRFAVETAYFSEGMVHLDHRWEVQA